MLSKVHGTVHQVDVLEAKSYLNFSWGEAFCCELCNKPAAAMAQHMPKMFSRRICRQLSPFQILSNPVSRTFRASIRNSPAQRSYATGESGPNPKPGQSPFKVWPFVAITVAGSAAYMLMVKSRTGTYHRRSGVKCWLSEGQFESRFKNQDSSDNAPTLPLHIYNSAFQVFTDIHVREQIWHQRIISKLQLLRKILQPSPLRT